MNLCGFGPEQESYFFNMNLFLHSLTGNYFYNHH